MPYIRLDKFISERTEYSRSQIKLSASQAAMNMVRKYLMDER